jgi:hypothetical protein
MENQKELDRLKTNFENSPAFSAKIVGLLVSRGSISEEDYKYITGEDYQPALSETK